MKARVLREDHPSYKNYGGRGIDVCEKWMTFKGFWEDMQEGYADNLSLDRIDNDSGYRKENCRWVSMRKQQRNRGNNHKLAYNGEEKCIAEWAELLNINYRSLYSRIYIYGWSVEKAIETPARKYEKNLKEKHIYRQTNGGRPQVRVRLSGVNHYIGTFSTMEEAIVARDEFIASLLPDHTSNE